MEEDNRELTTEDFSALKEVLEGMLSEFDDDAMIMVMGDICEEVVQEAVNDRMIEAEKEKRAEFKTWDFFIRINFYEEGLSCQDTIKYSCQAKTEKQAVNKIKALEKKLRSQYKDYCPLEVIGAFAN